MNDIDPEEQKMEIQRDIIIDQPALQQEPRITRIFTIRNQEYKYEGIKTEKIEQLLEILEKIERSERRQQNHTLQKIVSFFNSLNDQLHNKCPFLRNRLKIDVYQLLIMFVFFLVYFFMLIESINLQQDQVVKNDAQLLEMVIYLPYLTLLFTILSLIQQQIDNKTFWFILFITQFIAPLFVLLDYYLNLFETYSTTTYNHVGVSFCILFIIIFWNSIINKVLLYYSERIFNQLLSTLFICFQHILGSYLIVYRIIYLVTTCPYKYNYFYTFVDILIKIKVQFFIILFLQSIIFLKGMFKLQPNRILEQLEFCETQIMGIINFFGKDSKIYEYEYYWPCSSKLYILGYFGWQLYNFIFLMQQIHQSQINYEFVVGYLCILILFHIHIFLGMVVQQSTVTYENLFFWIPLITNIISIITIMIQKYLFEHEFATNFSLLIGLYQSIVGIIWISVIQFRSDLIPQELAKIISSFFLFFPLINYLTLQKMTVDSGIIYLLYIGLGIIIYGSLLLSQLTIFQFVQYLRVQFFKNIQEMYEKIRNVNLSDFFEYFNSIFQIISFQLLFYLLMNTPPQKATSAEKAILKGSLITITLNFLLNTKAAQFIQLDVVQRKQQYSILRKLISIFSILSFFILLIVSLAIQNQASKITILWCAIFVPLILLNFRFSLLIAIKLYQIARFIFPFLGFLLSVMILGFTAIFPIFFFFSDYNSDDNRKLISNFAYYFLFFLYIILTSFAVILQEWIQTNGKVQQLKGYLSRKLACDHVFLSNKVASFVIQQIITNKNFKIQQSYFEENKQIKIVKCSANEQEPYFYMLMIQNSYSIHSEKCKSRIDNLSENIVNFLILIFGQQTKSNQNYLETIQQLQPLNLQNEEKEDIIASIHQQQKRKLSFRINLKQDKRVAKLFWLFLYTNFCDEKQFLILIQIIFDNFDQEKISEKITLISTKKSYIDFLLLIQSKYKSSNIVDEDQLWYLAISTYRSMLIRFPQLEEQLEKSYDPAVLDIAVSEFYYPELNNQLKQWMQEQRKQYLNQSYIVNKRKQYFEKVCLLLNQAICEQPKYFITKCLKLKKDLNVDQHLLSQPKNEITLLQDGDSSDFFNIFNGMIEKLTAENINKLDELELDFSFTFSNAMALIFRIYEYFSLALSSLFYLFGLSDYDRLQSFLLMDWNIFQGEYMNLLAIAITITFFSILFGLMAIRQVNCECFGQDSNGKPATFRNGTFWLSKIIMVINTQYLFVMRTFIRSFKCDYSVFPYLFAADHQIECFSQSHLLYISVSIIFGLIFYLFVTLIYPNLQLNDKSIDLKFPPQYITMFMQTKFLLLCIKFDFQVKEEIIKIVFDCLAIYFLHFYVILFKKPLVLISNQIEWWMGFIIFQVYSQFIQLFFIAVMNKYIGDNAGWWFLLSQPSFIFLSIFIAKVQECYRRLTRQRQVHPEIQ